MVHGIIIATMLTLIGDNGSAGQVLSPPQPPSRPAQISMNAADWTLKHSPTRDRIWGDWNFKHRGEVYRAERGKVDRLLNNRPTSQNTRLSHPLPDPQGGWSLSLSSLFPGKTFPLAYLITTASPVLTQGQYVKMVGEISARGDVVVPPPMVPAWCSMYFRQVDDDPSYSKTYHLHYRWWSIHALLLHAGRFVMVVGLEPQFWRNAGAEEGDFGAAATAGFQRALANPQSIGIFCSGVFVMGQDYSHALFHPTLSITSFAVCDRSQGGATSEFADAPSATQENEACAPPSAQQR